MKRVQGEPAGVARDGEEGRRGCCDPLAALSRHPVRPRGRDRADGRVGRCPPVPGDRRRGDGCGSAGGGGGGGRAGRGGGRRGAPGGGVGWTGRARRTGSARTALTWWCATSASSSRWRTRPR